MCGCYLKRNIFLRASVAEMRKSAIEKKVSIVNTVRDEGNYYKQHKLGDASNYKKNTNFF